MVPVQAAQRTRQYDFRHASIDDFVQEDLHTVFGVHKVHTVGAQEGFHTGTHAHTYIFVSTHSNADGAVALVRQGQGRFGQVVVGAGVVALAQVAVFTGNRGGKGEEAVVADNIVSQERGKTRGFYVKDTVIFSRVFIVNQFGAFQTRKVDEPIHAAVFGFNLGANFLHHRGVHHVAMVVFHFATQVAQFLQVVIERNGILHAAESAFQHYRGSLFGRIGFEVFPDLFFERGQFGFVHRSPQRRFFLDFNNIQDNDFAVVLGGNLLGKHRTDTAAGTREDNGFTGKVKVFDALIQAGRQGENRGAHVISRTNHQAHIAVEHFVHRLLGHFVRRGGGFKVH